MRDKNLPRLVIRAHYRVTHMSMRVAYTGTSPVKVEELKGTFVTLMQLAYTSTTLLIKSNITQETFVF